MVLQQTHFSMLLTDWLSLIIYIRKMSEMLKRGQYGRCLKWNHWKFRKKPMIILTNVMRYCTWRICGTGWREKILQREWWEGDWN